MPPTLEPHAEESKKNLAPLTIGTIGAIVAIITPAAYLLGLRYYQGYMSAFGVESNGFPISAPDIYVFSYQAIGHLLLTIGELASNFLTTLFNPPVIYLAIGAAVVLISFIYWLLKSTRHGFHPRIQWILCKVKVVVSWLHWKNNDFTKSIGIVGLASYGVIAFATAAMAIAILWWLLPMSAYSKGHDTAQERIKLYLENGCHADKNSKWNNCFSVVDDKGNVIHEGLLIAVNDKEIAIFKKDGSYVFTRKDDSLLRRKRH